MNERWQELERVSLWVEIMSLEEIRKSEGTTV